MARKAGRNGSMRSPPKRLAWNIQFRILDKIFCRGRSLGPGDEGQWRPSARSHAWHRAMGERGLAKCFPQGLRCGPDRLRGQPAGRTGRRKGAKAYPAAFMRRARRREMVSRIVSPADVPRLSLTCWGKRSMSITVHGRVQCCFRHAPCSSCCSGGRARAHGWEGR